MFEVVFEVVLEVVLEVSEPGVSETTATLTSVTALKVLATRRYTKAAPAESAAADETTMTSPRTAMPDCPNSACSLSLSGKRIAGSLHEPASREYTAANFL